MSITIEQLNRICAHLGDLVPAPTRARPVHTARGPSGDPVDIVRDETGTDHVRAFGRTWTPGEADEIARLIASRAHLAAAHNAGALTGEVRA